MRAVTTRVLRRPGTWVALLLPLGLVVTTARIEPTAAALADQAVARTTVEALPTLWWASGTDSAGEHGDGTAGAGTSSAARVNWRAGLSLPKGVAVTDVAVGDASACAIAGGRLYCWGANDHGQLGDGSLLPSADPVLVATDGTAGSQLPAGAVVTDVSVGSGAACAVAAGDVYCWGDNTTGRLGHDSPAGSAVPVAVATNGVGGSSMPSGVATRVVTGGGGAGSTTAFTCAIADARAFCWGSRESGRLGDGIQGPTPRRVPGLVLTTGWGASVVQDIAAGEASACAVAGGKAYCWGRMIHGLIGNGINGPGVNQTGPVAVSTSPSSALPSAAVVSDVEVGATSACVVADGVPYCWGTNIGGQLGADLATDTEPSTTVVHRATQVALQGTGSSELPVDAGVLGLSTGGRLTGGDSWCLVAARPAETARPYCWGGGAVGQLGLGASGDSRVPRAMLTVPASQLPAGVDVGQAAVGRDVTIVVAAP